MLTQRKPTPLVEHVDQLKGLLRTAHTDATNLSVRRDLAGKAANKAQMSEIIAGIRVDKDGTATASSNDDPGVTTKHGQTQIAPALNGPAHAQSLQPRNTSPGDAGTDVTTQGHAAAPSSAISANAQADSFSVVVPTSTEIATSKAALTATVEAIPSIIAARERMAFTIELLKTSLEVVQTERQEWWNSAPKRRQRQEWIEQANYTNLSRQQAVNNTCVGMINDIEAAIGQYVHWVLE